MRRKRARAGWRATTRTGVTASVRHRKRRVQSPVERISASAGLGPSVFAKAPYSSQAKGSAKSTKAAGLAAGCSRPVDSATGSVVLRQVHAGVELADLGLVAVEHQRGAL